MVPVPIVLKKNYLIFLDYRSNSFSKTHALRFTSLALIVHQKLFQTASIPYQILSKICNSNSPSKYFFFNDSSFCFMRINENPLPKIPDSSFNGPSKTKYIYTAKNCRISGLWPQKIFVTKMIIKKKKKNISQLCNGKNILKLQHFGTQRVIGLWSQKLL